MLGAVAAAFAADACAQTFAPNPFEPALMDPRSAQRFTPPAGGTTRSTQAAPTPSIGNGAGETGFDSTGSIAKKRRTKPKPGATFPVPRAGAVILGPPQQAGGHTSAPQIAARAAYANAYKPIDAPQRRALPPATDPYEPTGLRVGSFLLRPSLEIGYGSDSNPNRTPNGPSSNFTQALGDVQIKSEWTRHELGATLRGSYVAYDKLSSVNRPAADTKVFGRYDATRDLRFEGEGRFLLGTDNPGSPNLQAGLAKLPIFTTLGASAGVAQRFNRLDLAVKGSFDRTTYQNSELTDGTSVSNADRNFNQYRIQGRVSYEFSPGFKPFVEIDADKRIHDNPWANRDSDGLTPKGGITFELLRYLTGEVSAGYTSREYKSPTLEPIQGFVLDGTLIWVATGLTTVTMTASSRVDESTQVGVSGALKRDVGFSIDHAFRRWLVGTLKAGYGQDDYVGMDRLDKRTSLGAAITYKFSREFWLKGEVRQDWLRSNVTSANYDATTFLIGLKMQR